MANFTSQAPMSLAHINSRGPFQDCRPGEGKRKVERGLPECGKIFGQFKKGSTSSGVQTAEQIVGKRGEEEEEEVALAKESAAVELSSEGRRAVLSSLEGHRERPEA